MGQGVGLVLCGGSCVGGVGHMNHGGACAGWGVTAHVPGAGATAPWGGGGARVHQEVGVHAQWATPR